MKKLIVVLFPFAMMALIWLGQWITGDTPLRDLVKDGDPTAIGVLVATLAVPLVALVLLIRWKSSDPN